MADEEDELEIEPPKVKTGGGNPLLTIVLIVNLLIVIAVAFFQFKLHEKMSNTPSVEDIVKAELKKDDLDADKDSVNTKADGILFPLQGFTANLAQGDGPRRFISVKLVLKFSKDSSEDEFKARKPQMRDSIISILNTKRPQDLLKIEGKNFLKEEIKANLNSFMIDGKVLDIYYISFRIN